MKLHTGPLLARLMLAAYRERDALSDVTDKLTVQNLTFAV